MLPVLVKPRLISAKNRWLSRAGALPGTQDSLVLIFSVFVALGLYNATFELLKELHFGQRATYLPPEMPLSMLLLFLFVLLVFSNGISALSALFTSKELDLILSSPLSKPRFFVGKFAEIYSSSSWMALIFGIPSFIAIGNFYDAPGIYYLALLFTLIPMFSIPSSIALIVVTLFTTLIPAHRTREVFIVFFIFLFFGIYFVFAEGKDIGNYPTSSVQQFFSVPGSLWLPSYWVSGFMGKVVSPGSHATLTFYLAALLSVSIALFSLAYLCFRGLHHSAYSCSLSSRRQIGIKNNSLQRTVRKLTCFLPSTIRAVALKEYKLFARDMAQAMQLLMLLGICLLYLYNFQALQRIDNLPEHTVLWWKAFLSLSNILMGSFVMTAICARFVFPCLSIEGRSFWILQSSPVSLRRIIHAKFYCWYFPVAITSTIVFVSGAFSIQASPFMVLFTALCSIILSLGVVGLGIGLGARFINLHWDHVAQLTTGFGNLMYMLCATALILSCGIPMTAVTLVYTLRELESNIPEKTWLLLLSSTILFMLLVNMLALRWSFRQAHKALQKLQA